MGLTIQMKTDTPMLTWVINLRAAGKKSPISMRLAIKLEVSTSRVTEAASSKSRRSKFHKLTLAMHLGNGAIHNLGFKLRLPRNRSHQRELEVLLVLAINHTRYRLINTITTCPMRRSKSLALSKSRREIWCSNRVTVTTSVNPFHQMTESVAKSTLNSKCLNPRPSSIKQLMLTLMGQKISKNHLINAPFCTY